MVSFVMANNTTVISETKATGADGTTLAIGASISVAAFVGVFLNALLIIALLKGKFLSTSHNPVYKLIFNLSCADAFQMAAFLLYMGPSSALQDWLLPNQWVLFASCVPHTCWYVLWVMLICISINRYICVCHPSIETFPSHSTATFLCIGSWILMTMIAAAEGIWSPCKTYLFYGIYTVARLGECDNYIEIYIFEIPGNALTTLVILFCYTCVVVSMVKSNSKVQHNIPKAIAKQKRMREARLTTQFMAISTCFTAVYVFTWVLQYGIPPQSPQFYAIVTFVITTDGTVNALVVLLYNEEVKAILRNVFYCTGKFGAPPGAKDETVDKNNVTKSTSSNTIRIGAVQAQPLQQVE